MTKAVAVRQWKMSNYQTFINNNEGVPKLIQLWWARVVQWHVHRDNIACLILLIQRLNLEDVNRRDALLSNVLRIVLCFHYLY